MNAFRICFVAVLVLCGSCGTARESNSSSVSTFKTDSVSLAVDAQGWEPQQGYTQIKSIAKSRDGRVAVADEAGVFVLDSSLKTGRMLAGIGSGPGEVRSVSGMIFLDDGRLLVRDMALTRINIYNQGGTSRGQIDAASSEVAGQLALRTAAGRLFMGVIGPARGPAERRSFSWHSVDTTGIMNPHVDVPYEFAEECPVTYFPGSIPILNGYTPEPSWALLPNGSTVFGCAATRKLELRHPEQKLVKLLLPEGSVERTAAERTELKQRFVGLMRKEVKDWVWSGPDIPAQHASFSRVFAGDDGSIWVKTPRQSERCAQDEDCAWRTRSGFNVYDSTGTFVRIANLPSKFSFRVDPVFSTSEVFAVIVDNEGIQHIARLK